MIKLVYSAGTPVPAALISLCMFLLFYALTRTISANPLNRESEFSKHINFTA